mgnify:CR=1 FL=1
MSKRKKKYFPNNWKPIKDAPEDAFKPLEYETFMDWKIGGYEIPQNVHSIVREMDVNTGKVKEHVYKYRHAAIKKCRKLMSEGNKEITVVQQDSVQLIDPTDDIFN